MTLTLSPFFASVPIDHKRLYLREFEAHSDLANRYAELWAGYERRGKTIEELTEKFTAKKERIHAFYAPQLENRKRELQELEDMTEFARSETLSANDWYLKADDLEEELKLERARRKNQRDTIVQFQEATGAMLPQEISPQAKVDQPVVEQSVHDSVIQEYEEQIGQLGRTIVRLTVQLNELQGKSDAFVEAHVRASHIINDAVVDWEESA